MTTLEHLQAAEIRMRIFNEAYALIKAEGESAKKALLEARKAYSEQILKEIEKRDGVTFDVNAVTYSLHQVDREESLT